MTVSDKPFCPTCEREFDDEKLKFCPYDATGLIYRSADSMVGQNFDGRYQIMHKLGEGGMGAVYKARQISTGKLVAIKVISSKMADNEDTLKRFQREVKLQSQLEHPNIVTIIDFSRTAEGQFFFVMGFAEGRSLRTVILEDGKYGIDTFVNLAGQTLDALEYAHAKNIVHRDLKADNIIIVKLPHQQIVKVLDFGLAKAFQPNSGALDGGMDTNLTQEGRVLGTPAYMSPEQAKGDAAAIGPASDIYSIGVVFYQMLTGRLPFASDTPWGVMHKHISETPESLRMVNPDIPEWLDGIIMKCLEKEIPHRYGSARDVREALTSKGFGDGGDVTVSYADNDLTIGVGDDPFTPRGDTELTIPDTASTPPLSGLRTPPPVPETSGTKKKKKGVLMVVGFLLMVGFVFLVLASGVLEEESPSEQVVAEEPLSSPPPEEERVTRELPSAEPGGGAKVDIPEEEGEGVAVPPSTPQKVADSLSPRKEVVAPTLPPAIKPIVKNAPSRRSGPVAHFRGGAMRSGFYKQKGPTENATLKWRLRTDDWVYSSPVAGGGMVYIGSDDGTFYAVDEKRGGLKWRKNMTSPIQGAPALAGGMVLVGDGGGWLHAFDSVTGKKIWSADCGGQPLFSSPVVTADTLYIGGGDGIFRALRLSTGSEKWRFGTGGKIDSSPALFDGVVIFGSYDDKVYALDAQSGKQKWSFMAGDSVGSSPAVANGTVYIGSDDGYLYALDAQNGQQKWRYGANDWVRSSPAVTGGQVYFGSKDGFLYSIDTQSGALAWRFETNDVILSSPVVAGDRVYIGSDDGFVYGVNATTGQQVWRYDAEGALFSSPTIGAGGALFIGDQEGLLALH